MTPMTEPRATKHLEMLQDVIARMAGNSFLIKGWSVTVAAAILALAAKDGGPSFAWIGCLVVCLFWSLDAYYLALERAFRELFVAAVASADETFDMRPRLGPRAIAFAAVRTATVAVHAPLLIAFVVAHALLSRSHTGC